MSSSDSGLDERHRIARLIDAGLTEEEIALQLGLPYEEVAAEGRRRRRVPGADERAPMPLAYHRQDGDEPVTSILGL